MDIGYNNTKQIKNTGVYNIRGVKHESKAIIKPAGMIELNCTDYVSDKPIDSFKLYDNIFGEVYLCNIVDSFLMSTKKLPIMYLTLFIERPMRRIYLFKLYLYFTITSKIKNGEDLINHELNGKFTVEIVIENNYRELDKKIDKYPGLRKVSSMFIDLVKTDDMTDFIKSLVDEENEKLKQEFNSRYGNCTIPKPTISLDDYLSDSDSDSNSGNDSDDADNESQ